MRCVLVELDYFDFDFEELHAYGEIVMVAPVEQALGMRCTVQQMEAMSKHPLVKDCIDVTEEIAELHRTLPEDFKVEGTYFVPFRTS